MTRATPVTLSLLVLVSLCVGVAGAQTYIHGHVSGSLGPGVYIVDGNCIVDAGNTLTVQPGTTFQFAGHYGFMIYGQLTAIGTVQDSINFIRQNPISDHDWSGVRFFPSASASSTLSYCLMDHAAYQNWPDVNGGAIYTQNVGITVSHSKISNCLATAGGGIYINQAPMTVSNCLFFNNTAGNGGGVHVYYCNGATVQNCIFAKCSATST